MGWFGVLIAVYAFFIYGIERRMRHGIEQENLSPFDERIIKKLQIIAKFFKGRIVWANIIFIVGISCSLTLFILALKARNQHVKAWLAGLSVFIQFFSVGISASFPGNTLVQIVSGWVEDLNEMIVVKIFKRLVFEVWSLSIVIPFLLIVFMFILFYSQINPSGTSVRLLFYFLPIFFVMWIYRYGDYDEFKMNVRRVMVYVVVAVLTLFNNDPMTKLFNVQSANTNFSQSFNEFSVLAFLALDRVGKVLIEIFSKAKCTEKVEKTG